jgi:hypothetical protein
MTDSSKEKRAYRIEMPKQPPPGGGPLPALARYVYATAPERVRVRDFPAGVQELRVDQDDPDGWLMPVALICLQWSAARTGRRSVVLSMTDVAQTEAALKLEVALDGLASDGVIGGARFELPVDSNLPPDTGPLGLLLHLWVEAQGEAMA